MLILVFRGVLLGLCLCAAVSSAPVVGAEPPSGQGRAAAESFAQLWAEWLNDGGAAALEAGRPREALAKFEEALAMRQRLFTGDHPDVAQSLNNVALALQALGRPGEALAKFEEALAMMRRLFKGDDANVATCLNNVALALDSLGRPREALTKLEEALAMRQRLFDGDHQDVAASLLNVAAALHALGRADEALAKFEQALAMTRRLFKGDHPKVASSLNNVALALESIGRPGEALPRLEEALAMRQRLFTGDHPDVAQSLNNVAGALLVLGRPGDALARFEEALAMQRRIFEGDHPDVAKGLNNVALALDSVGRHGQALVKLEEALAMQRRIFEGDHPDVAMSLSNVGLVLQALGRPAQALPVYEEALAIRQRLFKGDHPDLAKVLNNVAFALQALGRPREALGKFEQALAMMRRLFKGDHPDVATGRNNVALALHSLGRPGEALATFEEVLAIQQRLFKVDHPDVATSLHNVASALHALGRPEEALAALERAAAMGRRLRLPQLYMLASNLGWLHLKQGQPGEAVRAFEEAIDSMERARVEVGGDELDRAGFFAGISSEWRAFEGMVQAQLAIQRPDKAVEYLERGRARGLLDVLERGQRLQGKDLLGPVEESARAAQDERLLDEVLAVRQGMRTAESAVAQHTAEVGLLRGRKDLAEDRRKAEIDALLLRLDEAQEAYQKVRRAALNLLGEHVSFDLKPKTAGELQTIPSGEERLLVYSVSEERGLVFVVPPVGGAIRAEELLWPDGSKVTEKGLHDEVLAYLDGILEEGRLVRGVKLVSGEQELFDPLLQMARGQRLFRALVPSGVWKEIEKSGRVFLVPDRVLQRLPFEALVVKGLGTSSYWLDQGPAVVYGSSGTVLLGRREARKEQHRRRAQGSRLERVAVVLGDPIYERGEERQEPPPRRGVRVEAVSEGSLAQRLGIRAGAVITGYGEEAVGSVGEFDEALKVLLLAERGGQLEEAPRLRVWQSGAVFERGVPPGEALGVKLAELDSARVVVERSGLLSRYDSLARLPGTREEAEAIYEALRGKPYEDDQQDPLLPLLLGKDATRSRLFDLAPSSRFLHLATHGLINDESKVSYSSLALTVPEVPTAQDFGFLTLLDLFDHWWGRLRDAELVLLSGCETQRGVVRGEEAVYGLPWGFMYAGAPAVIASLWRVDDASTARLMGGFYRAFAAGPEHAQGVSGGADKLGAFLQARKRLKRQHPQPYFWAPFIYLGEPN